MAERDFGGWCGCGLRMGESAFRGLSVRLKYPLTLKKARKMGILDCIK